jgi:hypothetical protein
MRRRDPVSDPGQPPPRLRPRLTFAEATARLTPFRRLYIGFLALVWIAQAAGRALLFHSADTGAGLLPMLGQLLIEFSLLALLGLLLTLVALIPRFGTLKALAAAALTGCLHALLTAFDIYQAMFVTLTGQPGPTWAVFRTPALTLSLLDNVGLSPVFVQLVLLVLAALHVALYLPVAGLLVRAPLRLARQSVSAGPLRIRGWFLLLCANLSTGAILNTVPAQVRAALLEGVEPQWLMAPREMLAAAMQGPVVRREPAVPPPAGSRPLVLIVVDALRSDRMGVYNPRLGNTPFLSALEARGQLRRFDAYGTCTFSFCGVMSVLASRSWNDFGARPETIVDRLARNSYRAHLILAGEHSDFGGLPNLFGGPVASFTEQPKRSQPSDLFALGALAKLHVEDPRHAFVYIHLMSTHPGTFIEPPFRAVPGDTGKFGAFVLTGKAKAKYQQVYDLRVRQADDVLRRTFGLLEQKGILEDALVLITSDHGERTAEGGLLYHGGDADPPTLRIPLLIYDRRGTRYPAGAPVSQIDVAPTLAAAVGLAPAPGWKGLPLQRAWQRQAVPVGTPQSTGVVARLGGRSLLYLCKRRTGTERIVDVVTGAPVDSAAAVPVLRRLHRRTAASVRDPACA